MESGIEGNLPDWQGASYCYSRAYKLMAKHGPNSLLIDALNSGSEEDIKSQLAYYTDEEWLNYLSKNKLDNL